MGVDHDLAQTVFLSRSTETLVVFNRLGVAEMEWKVLEAVISQIELRREGARATCWVGVVPYMYAGCHVPQPATANVVNDIVLPMGAVVARRLYGADWVKKHGAPYGAQINVLQDGAAYVAAHSDDEEIVVGSDIS